MPGLDESALNLPGSFDCDLLTDVVEELGIGVVVISPNYRTLWANRVIVQKFGDVVGSLCFETYHGRSEVCSDCRIRDIFDRGLERVVCRHSSTDSHGNTVWSQITSRPLKDTSGKIVAAVEAILPITAQIEAEDALQARTARLNSIVRVAPIGIGLVVDRVLVEVNNQLSEMTGYSADELLGQPTSLFYPSLDDYEFVGRENCRQIGERGIGEVETRLRRKDGAILDVQLKSTPLDRNNLSEGVIFTALDISERKRVEAALRQSERKYRRVVENAHDAIFIAQDGRIKFPNPQMVARIGYSEEELSSTPFVQFIHPDDRAMVLENYRKRIMGEGKAAPYTFRAITSSGETLWVELTAVLINWEGKPASLTFARDITEQKRLESQLIQAQKMEAVGTLAGGVAHDFNNLLTGILGFTTLMLRTTSPDDPSHAKLRHIEQLSKSGAELTRQLLGFARGGRFQAKATDLNDLVQKTLELFGRTRKEIRVQSDLDRDLPAVEVDGSQIEQVLINLLVNAWQAMPRGGDITVTTRQLPLASERCLPNKIQPGNYVELSVTDTGEGMDEKTQQRVFEPFFTTKELGRGTGLGLASAYGIIKNHGGMIEVCSEPGKGATFSVFLPASFDHANRTLLGNAPTLSGSETLLLVDDEKVILEVGREILTLLGYKVLLAQSGQEAVDLFRQHRDIVDLVILDVAMPGMGGAETFERLKEIDPSVKVLLSSGYSMDEQTQEILRRGCRGFLEKPYTVQHISVKIRSALRNSR